MVGLAALAVLVGVVLQRITGSGIGIVSGPPLVLLLGPVAGVQVLHVVAAACSLLLLAGGWREVDWRRTAVLTGIALAATPLGVGLAFALPEVALQIAMGLVMLAALFTVDLLARTRLVRGRWGSVLTGALGGVANGTVGQAGPIMSAYAAASNWRQSRFVASMQVCWFVVNVAAAALKGLPPVAPTLAGALLGALAVGFALSVLIERLVPHTLARRAMIVVAVVGSVAVLAQGVGGLVWSAP